VRLVVVAQNPMLAEALQRAGYDIEEAPVDDERGWVRDLAPDTAVIVQVADPDWVVDTRKAMHAASGGVAGGPAPLMVFVANPAHRERLDLAFAADPGATIIGLPMPFEQVVEQVRTVAGSGGRRRRGRSAARSAPPAPAMDSPSPAPANPRARIPVDTGSARLAEIYARRREAQPTAEGPARAASPGRLRPYPATV
jgi:hypothetical protein